MICRALLTGKTAPIAALTAGDDWDTAMSAAMATINNEQGTIRFEASSAELEILAAKSIAADGVFNHIRVVQV